jgi:hypothetical protein
MQSPRVDQLLSSSRHGLATISVFIGLDGSHHDLKLPGFNTWYYPAGPDYTTQTQKYGFVDCP